MINSIGLRLELLAVIHDLTVIKTLDQIFILHYFLEVK